MYHRTQSTLTLVCHPFMFALKEGQDHQENMMDFSLMLLHRTCTEWIQSPSKYEKNGTRILYVDSTPSYVEGSKKP